MSRKMLRRSSMKKSFLCKGNSPGMKPSYLGAFFFDSEPNEGAPPLSTPDSGSKKGSLKTNKSKKIISTVPDIPNALFFNESDTANEEMRKKNIRKRKIRITQDLNNLELNDENSDVHIKRKPKKTKKARLPSFLPPVNMIEEDITSHPSCSSDSDNKENDIASDQNTNVRRGRSNKSRKKKESGKISHNDIQVGVVQDNTVGSSLSEENITVNPKINVSKNELNRSLEPISSESSGESSPTKKTKLKREGTFEISSMSPQKLFTIDLNEVSSIQNSPRNTYNAVPIPKSKRVSGKICQPIETVDLTESVLQIDSSPVRQLKRKNSQNKLETSIAMTRESSVKDKKDYLHTPSNKLDTSALPSGISIKRRTWKTLNGNTINHLSKSNSFTQTNSSQSINNSTFDKEPSVIGKSPRKGNNLNSNISVLPSKNLINSSSNINRKSSFDVSFNLHPERKSSNGLLENLNITTRDSSKRSSSKKSSNGFKHSTGSAESNSKNNFVTIRRQCHTMIEFDIDNSFENHDVNNKVNGLKKTKNCMQLNEECDKSVSFADRHHSNNFSKKISNISKQSSRNIPSSQKGILKKSTGLVKRNSKRDTFEMAEAYYESLEAVRVQSLHTGSTVINTPNQSTQDCTYKDVYDLLLNTPTTELGNMMVGNHESVLIHSFADETGVGRPRLTRMGTFTKAEEKTHSTEVSIRRSNRKRWSQVEKTPIFNTNPPVSKNGSAIDASISGTKTKAVRIKTPPITPKMKLRSPLVARKTPKPNFQAADNSILSGNCAFLPADSSTPFSKTKDASLLKKVLTANKSKGETKNLSRVKMPNFRKIHERQFEKMENIKEMQNRKAKRAEYLMSGCKVPINSSKSDDKESRKKLKFSPIISRKIPISKPVQHMLNKRSSLERKKNKKLEIKLPVSLKHVSPIKSKVLKSKPADLKNATEPKQPKIVKKSALQVKPDSNPEVFTRFGFKRPAKEQSTKEEQIKAVIAKSKLAVNTTAKNRKQISEVRTNRRFELLMQMRAKK